MTLTQTETTYTIQQAAQACAVTPYTLRYYEEQGLIPDVQRNRSGYRVYTEQDLGWIKWLKMLRASGMSMEMLKRFIGLILAGDDSIPARCEILSEHRQQIRARIEELQGYLLLFDQKLAFYRGLEGETAVDERPDG